MPEEPKPDIGPSPRGQAWVELHGTFTAGKLRDIASQLDKNMAGMEKKQDGHPERHDN
jgi:hypothetical protein